MILLLPWAYLGAAHADETLSFSGLVPDDGGDFFTLAFEVPEGTAELVVTHRSLGEGDILDWGLYGPDGFRGWGGGNTEDALVAEEAASRSYLTGPLTPGAWAVLVGKAKLVSDAPAYAVEVTLRDAPVQAPQVARRPYTAVDLGGGPGWYAGDFHVHSRESGDASPTLDEIAAFARSRGLDFVEVSDHNTTSQVEWLGDAQDRWPDLLFLPGVEITTYAGHANGIGLTVPVPFAIGWEVPDFAATAERVDAEGAVLSINHPVLDLGSLCIGCAWEHPLPGTLGALEIGSGGWEQGGKLFDPLAIALWDELCDSGLCPAAIGGSDDHRAGTGTGTFDSPIGSPTTMVWADTLSAEGILAGIRAGRTVVKLWGPDDPMIDLAADALSVTATVTGGLGMVLHIVEDGLVTAEIPVDADPFAYTTRVQGARVRAEVWADDAPRTVTSHLFPEPAAEAAPPSSEEDCGCHSTGAPAGWISLVGLLAARRRRRSGRRA